MKTPQMLSKESMLKEPNQDKIKVVSVPMTRNRDAGPGKKNSYSSMVSFIKQTIQSIILLSLHRTNF